jgi:hypothetical protein
MNIIRQKRYTCVGCEQEVETIGGYMHIVPPPPLIPAIRVCEPCSRRMNKSVGFRKAAEARVMAYAGVEVLAHIAAKQGLTVETVRQRSLSSCHGLTRDMCAHFDHLFQLPLGSHWSAQSLKKPGLQQ